MTKAAELYSTLAQRLADPLEVHSDLDLRRMLADLKHARAQASAGDLGLLWLLTSTVRERLGHHDDAVHAARNAVLALPQNAAAHNQLGIALGRAGRADEALGPLQTARGLADAALLPTVLCNLATAARKLGDADGADEILGDAVRAAMKGGFNDMVRVAAVASAQGAEKDAVELVARAVASATGVPRPSNVPALTILDAAPAEMRERLMANPYLERAVRIVRENEASRTAAVVEATRRATLDDGTVDPSLFALELSELIPVDDSDPPRSDDRHFRFRRDAWAKLVAISDDDVAAARERARGGDGEVDPFALAVEIGDLAAAHGIRMPSNSDPWPGRSNA